MTEGEKAILILDSYGEDLKRIKGRTISSYLRGCPEIPVGLLIILDSLSYIADSIRSDEHELV